MSDINMDTDTVLSVPVDDEAINKLIDKLIQTQKLKNDINVKSIKIDFGDELDSQSNKATKSIKKTNNALSDTNKNLDKINKQSKLFQLMHMGLKGVGAAFGAVGLSAGALLFSALKNTGQNIQQQYQAQNLGMTVPETRALEISSEKITGSKSAFTQAVNSMVSSLNDVSKAGLFPTLGLDQATLKTLNPEKAFELILESVKNKPQGITGQVYRESFEQITGGAVSYNVATQQGAGDLAKYFNDYLNKYSGVDFDALQKSSRALIDFQAQLDITSQKIGGALAEPLSRLAEKATPALEMLADAFGNFIDSISEEDINKFIDNMVKIFNFIGGVTISAAGIIGPALSGEKPNIVETEKQTVKQLEEGDIKGAVKTQLIDTAKQTANLFTESGRETGKETREEAYIIQSIRAGQTAKQLESTGYGLGEAAEKYGYINPVTKEFTQKAVEVKEMKTENQAVNELVGETLKGIGRSIAGFFTGKGSEENQEEINNTYTTLPNPENDIDNINNETTNKNETSNIFNSSSQTSNTNNSNSNTSTYVNQVIINVKDKNEAVSTANDLSKSINTQSNYGYTNMRGR